MKKELIKLANELDKRSLRKEADYLDIILRKLAHPGEEGHEDPGHGDKHFHDGTYHMWATQRPKQQAPVSTGSEDAWAAATRDLDEENTCPPGKPIIYLREIHRKAYGDKAPHLAVILKELGFTINKEPGLVCGSPAMKIERAAEARLRWKSSSDEYDRMNVSDDESRKRFMELQKSLPALEARHNNLLNDARTALRGEGQK